MQTTNQKKKKVLFVARDDGGCGFFRCKQPAEFLNRAGVIDAEYVFKTPTKDQLMHADLVIMQDMGTVEASNMAKFMRDNKIPYLTEFDDYVFHVSPHNLAGHQAWNPSTLFLHRALEMTKSGAGITVSTNTLAREFFPYSNLIYVIPNYLDKERWDQPVVKRSDDKIRIGWCGGNAHADDLHMISKVLDKVIKEYKGKVIFETMGMTRQELANVFPMKVHNDLCPSCGYEGELHHYPGESLDEYPTVLASKGWDFAVAPVIDNAFGNSKSDIKIKEYAALKLPVIASPVDPYREAAKSGAQILFAETFEEWYEAIKLLIEDVSKRREMAINQGIWAENNWIQDNIGKLSNIYLQVISLAEAQLGTTEDRLKRVGVI